MTEIKRDERQLPLMQPLLNCGGFFWAEGRARARAAVCARAQTRSAYASICYNKVHMSVKGRV